MGSGEADIEDMLDNLGKRGISRLMVEGGAHMHTEFFRRDLADELHLAIAPILVGQDTAPRFLLNAIYPIGRVRLIEATEVGDVALLRYAPKERSH